MTTGPDGRIYPTWHPQIDPSDWCYFRHEHGTDPAYFDANFKPPFGYASTAYANTTGAANEAHEGFKVYVTQDSSYNPPGSSFAQTGYQWMWVHHFGTASLQGTCVRYHEGQVHVKDLNNGELVAHLYGMLDFGKSAGDAQETPYRPDACPNQAAGTEGSNGIRIFPRQDAAEFAFYEPWRPDPAGTSSACRRSSPSTRPTRSSTAPALRARPPGPQHQRHRYQCASSPGTVAPGVVAGNNSGANSPTPGCCNLSPRAQPGAIQQYVKAGLRALLPPRTTDTEAYDVYGFGRPYIYGGDNKIITSLPTAREGSLSSPN